MGKCHPEQIVLSWPRAPSQSEGGGRCWKNIVIVAFSRKTIEIYQQSFQTYQKNLEMDAIFPEFSDKIPEMFRMFEKC